MAVTFPASTAPPAETEPDTTSAPDGEKAEKPKQTNDPRNYDVHIRLTGTIDAIAKELAKHIKDGKGEVLVKLGTESALQPKLAMKKYGDQHELKGNYVAVAERAFAEFPGLETESVTKTKIKGL